MFFIVYPDEARGLLPHLLQFTEEHYEEGLSMQQLLNQFQSELKDALDEIWTRPPEETPVDSWASRMIGAEKGRKTNPIDRVTKPDLPGSDWRICLFGEGVI